MYLRVCECVCVCVCYWKQPVNIVAVGNGKGREFFATCCIKRTVLTVEKHWEIKKSFFFTCCHLLHCVLLNVALIPFFKVYLNQRILLLRNFPSSVAVVVERKTSTTGVLLHGLAFASVRVPCALSSTLDIFLLPVALFSVLIIGLSLDVFFKAHSTVVLSSCSAVSHSSHFPVKYLVCFNRGLVTFCCPWFESWVQCCVKSWWMLRLNGAFADTAVLIETQSSAVSVLPQVSSHYHKQIQHISLELELDFSRMMGIDQHWVFQIKDWKFPCF